MAKENLRQLLAFIAICVAMFSPKQQYNMLIKQHLKIILSFLGKVSQPSPNSRMLNCLFFTPTNIKCPSNVGRLKDSVQSLGTISLFPRIWTHHLFECQPHMQTTVEITKLRPTVLILLMLLGHIWMQTLLKLHF
jgi:hypothetical protein